MSIAQRTLIFTLVGLVAFFGWKALVRGAQETAVLHTGTVDNKDYFAVLWVVDDEDFVWIRAESPDRRWLPAVRQDSNVTLRRHGHEVNYRASIWDSDDARAHVDSLFRRKYGVAEAARALVRDRETIPIRLDHRR